MVRGLLRRIRQFSIWRVPNYFIEPTGVYLGERVRSIDRLNSVRTWAGIIFVAGTAVYYLGLNHLATVAKDKTGTQHVTIGTSTPEGNWLIGLILSVVLAMFVLPVVSLCLVWWTRRGSRRAALYQLRWPGLAMAGYFGVFAVAAPVTAFGGYLQKSASHMEFGIRAAAWVLVLVLLVLQLTWVVKALYLAATGLFRAEDAHPLLPLITAPVVAAGTSLLMNTVGSDGLEGVPGIVGDALAWGGTITITIVSLRSAQILKRQYPSDWPFRNGPPVPGAVTRSERSVSP